MKLDRPVLLLAAAQILIWAGLYYVFPALIVRWEDALGWSKADLTLAITLAIFVSALVSPFSGRLIDHGHGPAVMTGGAVFGSACLFGVSLVENLGMFYALWCGIGMAFGCCLYDPCFALITRCRGETAKRAIILVTLIAGFADALSFPAAYALAEWRDWRLVCQVFAATVLLLGAPLVWFGASNLERNRVEQPPAEEELARHPSRFFRLPRFWLLATGFAFAALVHGVTLQHLLPILRDRGIHPEVAVTAASFIGPMQVAGRLAMIAAQRYVSNHGVAIACFLVMALSVLLLMLSSRVPPLVVFFVIAFGGGYGMVSIIRPVIAREILGERNFGAKFGALSMVYLVGSASAPFLGSLVWQVGGYALVLPCLVAVAAAGLVLYMLAFRLSPAWSPGSQKI